MPAKVAALAVGEDERVDSRAAAREVKLGELTRDRLEKLGLASALRLRRRDLVA
jgi:hypothetical protein